jgi:MFS family permease
VATFLSELIAPPLGSLLMERYGSGYTYFITLPWDLVSFVLIFLLPETSKLKDPDTETVADLEPMDETALLDEDLLREPASRLSRYHAWMHKRYTFTKDHIFGQVLPLLKRREIFLGIAALVVAVFARPVSEMLLQYMSARFHWKLSKAAFLLSYQASVRLLSFSVLFPLAHYWLHKRLQTTEATDITFGIWSAGVKVVGLVGIGISTSWIGVIIGKITFISTSLTITSSYSIHDRKRSGCGSQVFRHVPGISGSNWSFVHDMCAL